MIVRPQQGRKLLFLLHYSQLESSVFKIQEWYRFGTRLVTHDTRSHARSWLGPYRLC